MWKYRKSLTAISKRQKLRVHFLLTESTKNYLRNHLLKLNKNIQYYKWYKDKAPNYKLTSDAPEKPQVFTNDTYTDPFKCEWQTCFQYTYKFCSITKVLIDYMHVQSLNNKSETSRWQMGKKTYRRLTWHLFLGPSMMSESWCQASCIHAQMLHRMYTRTQQVYICIMAQGHIQWR
jgi:hypothetical protein